MKRLFDITVSALALVLLWPLFLCTACLIKLDSPGPVFYRQTRVGRHGKPFTLYKFRSMHTGAERQGLSLTVDYERKPDPRVTRLGISLRRTKWDEMPQLWNVLAGQMSLVGPRPEVPCYVECYTPAQREVLSVRPGMTDPSSLKYRNESELLAQGVRQTGWDADRYYRQVVLQHKLACSLAYLRSRSLGSDIRVIFHTIFLVFRRSK